jgi:predicted enzyme related to lactoylglutathione lyase
MHKSRLAGFIIDCKTDDLDAAADFWAAALGFKRNAADTPATGTFVHMERDDPNGLFIEVQRVAHDSRVHIDIESDNFEAEVERLACLGAKTIKNNEAWWVLEAPTGQRFCVVKPKRANFDKEANVWA